MSGEIKFEKRTAGAAFGSMLRVDLRRLLSSSLLYIMLGISLVAPILILVMTTMMDGSVSVDPTTGAETVIEGFDSVWQIIGSVSAPADGGATGDAAGGMAGAGMSLTSMCNINMLYMGIAVFVCLFVSAEFSCGYSKNLFTLRADKTDYVLSKTLVLFLGGALMIVFFFIGSMLGGAISGLPFDLGGATAANVVFCLLAKLMLVGVFVPIFLAIAVAAKQRAWLSILLSLGGGMLLFMMIPMVSPLDSTPMNMLLATVGAALFSGGLAFLSRAVLRMTSRV